MPRTTKKEEEKKVVIPLKKYTHAELIEWDQKFKGMHNNEKGVIFGAYRKEVRHFPASEWKPDPAGYDVAEYFVRPEMVAEFENLTSQIDRMKFGENQRDKQLEKSAEGFDFKQEWNPRIPVTPQEDDRGGDNWFSNM